MSHNKTIFNVQGMMVNKSIIRPSRIPRSENGNFMLKIKYLHSENALCTEKTALNKPPRTLCSKMSKK